MVVDGVVSITDGLTNEFTLSEASTAVDDDELGGLRLVAVRQVIEFALSINELAILVIGPVLN